MLNEIRRRLKMRPNSPPSSPLQGRARVDVKTKRLALRLRPGDLAVVAHEDLDETAARALVHSRVRAVVNVRPFLTGRFPALGAQILHEHGIALIEAQAADLAAFTEGAEISFDGRNILDQGNHPICAASRIGAAEIEEQMTAGRRRLHGELEQFIGNTLAYAEAEKSLILSPLSPPSLTTQFRARQVLIVIRGQDYGRDLAAVRGYIREVHPVLIGVDGGADALLSAGMKPHLIVGDMDSVSDHALTSGAELVVHAYPDGRAPGQERLQKLGLRHCLVRSIGTSEDLAMLLAYEQGAELIVAVGSHLSMFEFLEKGRPGMASTLLTRIKVGSILVDAKGVSKLYQRGVRWTHLVVLAGAGLLTMILIFLSAPATQNLGQIIWLKLRYTFGF
jgi:uncharacterized membrane-anchored protein